MDGTGSRVSRRKKEGPDVWIELAAEYAADKDANKPLHGNTAAVQSSVVNSCVPYVSHNCPNPNARKVMNVDHPTRLPALTECCEPSPRRCEQTFLVQERPLTAPRRQWSEIRNEISNSRPKDVQDRLDRFRTKRGCKKAEEQPKEESLAKKPVITSVEIRKHAALCPSRRRWKGIRDEIYCTTPKDIQDSREERLRLEQ